ncbi:hypothetical protein NDU88_008318 [Pleurodeles waltl]|uniref:Uncharacterized protein n=1 Tax=Pleurodeles waltl TaxID=8319 RepID=A0AAV7N8S0_PLEWA|nr:hypothetical protein NDU88_008318 [Pleurodeles waltl]
MCLPVFGGTRNQFTSLEEEGAASGGRPRHWERAALELRRVPRGAAQIPLRGNPGRISTSKVPGRNSQEPGSAVTRAKQAAGKEAVEEAQSGRVEGVGAPPLFSNPFQRECGGGTYVRVRIFNPHYDDQTGPRSVTKS